MKGVLTAMRMMHDLAARRPRCFAHCPRGAYRGDDHECDLLFERHVLARMAKRSLQLVKRGVQWSMRVVEIAAVGMAAEVEWLIVSSEVCRSPRKAAKETQASEVESIVHSVGPMRQESWLTLACSQLHEEATRGR